MKHVMVDLETRGILPGAALLSIGACRGDYNRGIVDTDNTFYRAVLLDGQLEHGLHESPDTLAWWAKKSAEARAVFTDPDAVTLPEALEAFNAWLRPDDLVYGNGADFDNPILAVAYHAAGVPQGWKAFNGRCYRTLKNAGAAVKLVREGTYHNALADAISQAKHLCEIVKAFGGKMVLS